MKIRNILALAALCFMLVFASCKKEDKGGIPDHLRVIPDHSTMVMTINAKTLVEKGGLDKYKEFELYKAFHSEMAESEPQAVKLIDEFLKDTRVSGFNFDQIFVYTLPFDEYDQEIVATFGVEDSDKAAKWLVELFKTTGNEVEIVEGKDYKSVRIDYSSLLVWDKTKALLLNIREYQEEDMPSIESLLTIDEERSIVSNVDFMESYNAKKDFTAWMSLKSLIENYAYPSDHEFAQLFDSLGWDKASLDFSLNFTNEKATLSYSILPVSLVEEAYQKYPILKDGLDQSLLKYFPKESFFSISAAFNVKEYYKAVVENLSKISTELENGSYSGILRNHPSDMETIITAVSDPQVAKIVNSFKGDIIGTIFGFQEGGMSIPLFGLAVSIEGEEAFNNLLALIPDDIIKLTKTDNYYSYKIPYVTEIYVGQKEDVMYITNTKEALDNFYGQGYKENISSTTIGSAIKSNHILYSLSLDLSKYPALVTTALIQAMGTQEYSILSNIVEPFSLLSIGYPGENAVEANLTLKNTKENSLKVLLKTIDSYIAKSFLF